MWDIFLDIFLDALIDSLKILPFLLAMHILIEVYEYRAGSKLKVNKLLNGKAAPLLGGAVGLIPQCGFSVVATKLYCGRNIKLGTLLAVYIATSDEAIPILLSDMSSAPKLLPLLGIKFLFALSVGYGVNLFLRKKQTVPQVAENIQIQKGCHGHEIGHSHESEQDETPTIQKNKKFDYSRFIIHPIIHSLTILAFIFAVNIVLNAIIEFVGQDRLYDALNSAKFAQAPLAGLIGLIPNCASSVVITQMYAQGALTLGAAVTGLSVNAGIAYAVLFKENKNLKQNLLIIAGLYAASTILGTIITAIM